MHYTGATSRATFEIPKIFKYYDITHALLQMVFRIVTVPMSFIIVTGD